MQMPRRNMGPKRSGDPVFISLGRAYGLNPDCRRGANRICLGLTSSAGT